MVIEVDQPAELAEEGGVDRLLPPLVHCGSEGGPRRRRGAFEQLGDERLQADVELRQLGGREALALRHPRVEERRDFRGERAAAPVLLGGLEHGKDAPGRHDGERTQEELALAVLRPREPLFRPVGPLRRRLASAGDRGERARAEELRRVPGRERERIVPNTARIGEQGDEAFEQLFVLELFGVDPVAVLGQQLRQRSCLDEPVLFVTWHRLVCTRNAVVSRVPRPGQAVPVGLLL